MIVGALFVRQRLGGWWGRIDPCQSSQTSQPGLPRRASRRILSSVRQRFLDRHNELQHRYKVPFGVVTTDGQMSKLGEYPRGWPSVRRVTPLTLCD
jgi:hypothetical protein